VDYEDLRQKNMLMQSDLDHFVQELHSINN